MRSFPVDRGFCTKVDYNEVDCIIEPLIGADPFKLTGPSLSTIRAHNAPVDSPASLRQRPLQVRS